MASYNNLPSSTAIQVETIVFPPYAKPPGATDTLLILGGAGVRNMQLQGKLVKITGVAVYLDQKAIPWLARKWEAKNTAELKDSDEFYRDIVTGPFEKMLQITMIVPLTGEQFSEKVSERCVGIWVANGSYRDEEDAEVIEKFMKVFKDRKFSPGCSILFTMSPDGSLSISFSENSGIPEVVNGVLEHEKIGGAIPEMLIGKEGVSQETKESLALRISQHIKISCNEKGDEVASENTSKYGLLMTI